MGQKLESSGVIPYGAIVDKDGRQLTFSTTLPEEHHVNQVTEKTWNIPFKAIDPTSDNDYFIHVRNTDTSVRVIPRISVTSTVAGYIEIQAVSGTSIGGGDVVPVNNTVGGSAPANLTAETAVDITGLTDDGVLHFHWLEAAKTSHIEIPATIRLKQNQAMAILWVPATGILTGIIEIYEEEAD